MLKSFIIKHFSEDQRELVSSFLRRYRRLRAGRKPVEVLNGIGTTMLGAKGVHSFFGYYDLSPFDAGNKRVLAHQVPIGAKGGKGYAKLGWFDLSDPTKEFHQIGQTPSWCWQQGARLRWMPGTAHDDAVFYNSAQGHDHFGVIAHAVSGEVIARTSRPLYDISPDGNLGLSLNFGRLGRLRPGYGYNNYPDQTVNHKAPKSDGIWLVDMNDQREELLLSLSKAIEIAPDKTMADAQHYFNHLDWNPSGSCFIVFHIWETPDQGRHIRVLAGDRNGDFRLVTLGSHISHYWWLDDRQLLVYGTPKGGKRGYYIYEIGGNGMPIEGPLQDMPKGDGHPSRQPVGALLGQENWIVTDTLVDRLSERHVYLYHMPDARLLKIASVYSPFKYRKDFRCDLHPRWSQDGTQIAIDTSHNGYRQIMIIDPKTVLSAG